MNALLLMAATLAADPTGPLELTIEGKTEYVLDTGGKSPAEYKKAIDDAVKAGGFPPAPPKVELKVVVKNTSDKPVRLWTKGDPVILTLTVKGTGALNVEPPIAMTQEFRIPEATEVAAGKAVEFPVKSLTSGTRGASRFSYWTAPGEYELTASLRSGVQPKPEGAQDFDGFGVVVVTGKPVKITVTAKK